ncbi:PIN domain-containing protein [Streptomyces rishiriensis]|uniref:PIN domain-containing protein n=1 Tax=Streptomyces rishiriensis TaxID=68264 RepID=UPI00131F3DA8|nr:PIN domain-containing protein [Streptomyces rishiriensis]
MEPAALIILDTNILWKGTETVTADLLKVIRTSGIDRVAVPWVVLEELTAQRTEPHREKYEKAAKALQSLKGDTPWPLPTLPAMDLPRIQDHWRRKYLDVVDVIPTSEATLKKALIREANVLPPCKRVASNERDGGQKIGGRDAAIWLTAVEYAREHPDETVYFVSENTKDFGDGSEYPYPMNQDLEGLEDRFVLLTNWYEVMEKFTQRTEDVYEDAVRSLLSDPESLSVIEAESGTRLRVPRTGLHGPTFEATMGFFVEDEGTLVTTEAVRALGWVEAPTAVLDHVSELKAYRIGEHVWCIATVRWALGGPALLHDSLQVKGVGCTWETRVLVSPTSADAQLTVLRGQDTQVLNKDPLDTLTPELAARVGFLAQRPRWARIRDRRMSELLRRTRMERFIDEDSPF